MIYSRYYQTIFAPPTETESGIMARARAAAQTETSNAIIDLVRYPDRVDTQGNVECLIIIYFPLEEI